LHRAYKKQADRGLLFLASHQDVKMTKDRLKKGECYVGLDGAKMIATCTYYRHHNDPNGDWYIRPDVATYGQFAVHPDYQNKGLGIKLIELMESLGRRDGAKEITIDTSEKASDLISFYKKRGYREVGPIQWTLVNYRSVMLSKGL
jgi:GNAT superfamily N-acetyltransferase